MTQGQVTLRDEFMKGLWKDNPILVQVLGTCPTLAVTSSAINGIAMGLATTFVLLASNIAISLLRNFIPDQVRIAAYMIVIAAFVTIADMFLAAQYPDISRALGPFVPLIVVNCIILGRAEAFASKNGVGRSILDALGMGAGFSLVLLSFGIVRELMGTGGVFGIHVAPDWYTPWLVMILPAGAFFTFGSALGLMTYFARRRAA